VWVGIVAGEESPDDRERGAERFTWLRGLLLVLLVGSVVGLKVVS